MGRIKYDTILDALKDMKPGEYRDVRVKNSLVSMRKGNETIPKVSLYSPYTPPKKAKVITK